MRPRRAFREEHGQTGPASLVLLIAAIIVASLTIAGIYQSTGKLTNQGSDTAREVDQHLSNNLAIASLVGSRSTSVGPLKQLEARIQLQEGHNFDLSLAQVQLLDGAKIVSFDYVDGTPSTDTYNGSAERDDDGGFTPSAPVLSPSDVVRLSINLTAAGMELLPSTNAKFRVIPDVGGIAEAVFITPEDYGIRLSIELV